MYYYSLKIKAKSDLYPLINSILQTEPTSTKYCWEIERNTDDQEGFDFISTFLNLLEGNYAELKSIGVDRSDISIWMLYEYKEQCNMEFLPTDMKRLGDNNIALCISCWEK